MWPDSWCVYKQIMLISDVRESRAQVGKRYQYGPIPVPPFFCLSFSSPSVYQAARGSVVDVSSPSEVQGRTPAANACVQYFEPFGGNKTVYRYGSRQKEAAACHTGPYCPTLSTVCKWRTLYHVSVNNNNSKNDNNGQITLSKASPGASSRPLPINRNSSTDRTTASRQWPPLTNSTRNGNSTLPLQQTVTHQHPHDSCS